jgi:hypothetical protein
VIEVEDLIRPQIAFVVDGDIVDGKPIRYFRRRLQPSMWNTLDNGHWSIHFLCLLAEFYKITGSSG